LRRRCSSPRPVGSQRLARIRGIGTVGDNPGLESSVAVFIDGVYRSRSGIGLNELGEIDRVEVLRGPQGTLFGRNASAGLINIITKKPSFTPEATAKRRRQLRPAPPRGGVTGPLPTRSRPARRRLREARRLLRRSEANDTTVNNRNRFFTRGQLLFSRRRAVGPADRRLHHGARSAAAAPSTSTTA
jgi:iron complex outermembrane receptor protein